MAKLITGIVVSTKMNQTIVVQVETKFRHPLYHKVIVRHKKIKAHCENKDIKEGDVVTIRECAPISKDKHFVLASEKEQAVLQPTKKEVREKKAAEVKQAEVEVAEAAVEPKDDKPVKKSVKTAKTTVKKTTKSSKKSK